MNSLSKEHIPPLFCFPWWHFRSSSLPKDLWLPRVSWKKHKQLIHFWKGYPKWWWKHVGFYETWWVTWSRFENVVGHVMGNMVTSFSKVGAVGYPLWAINWATIEYVEYNTYLSTLCTLYSLKTWIQVGSFKSAFGNMEGKITWNMVTTFSPPLRVPTLGFLVLVLG